MKLRNSAGDKSLLGIFQNGSILLLCLDRPLDPIGIAPPMAYVQEAIPFDFFGAPLLPPLFWWPQIPHAPLQSVQCSSICTN